MIKLNKIISYKKTVTEYFPYLAGLSFCIFITFFFRDIPFFWDGAFFSETAVYFYDNGYGNLIVSLDSDTGGFPLYGIYLSLWWKVFGKTLLVSHIAILPVALGIYFEFIRIAKLLLKPQFVLGAVLLLMLEPTIITQTIIMSYDVILLYFSLVAITCMLKEKRILYSVILILVAASSTRGIIIIITLLALNISLRIINKQRGEIFRDLISYIPVIFFFFIWGVIHYFSTGWVLFSPLRETDHESFSGLSMILRQFFYSLWKISDFGRIFLIVFIFTCIILYFRKLKSEKKFMTVTILIIIPVIFSSLFIMMFSNPVSHRYFLLIYVFIILSAIYFIQQLKSRMVQLTIYFVFIVSLFSGNFWLYPQKYGNGWDSSLKILPYFEMENEMKEFVEQNNIDQGEVCTLFPMHKNYRYSHLVNYDFCYSDFDKTDSNNCKYFLYSNICNTDDSEIENHLKNNWTKLKEIKTKHIFLVLYKHI